MKILSHITLDNGVNMTFEVKNNMLWIKMDEPTDKEMMVTIYEVLSNNTGQKTEGKETTYHHSELDKKHLFYGTYIFTFSNDKYIHLTVVFMFNKLIFEVY